MARRRDLWWLAAGVVCLAAWNLAHWWLDERAWLDDAWISFRYARALLDGHGFVYNPEDGPVEGFTNLAWVLLTAAAMKLGAAPEHFARTLGLASHLVTVALIGSLGWRRGVRTIGAKVGAVVAAALPGATHGLLAIAGSGLETAFAALLIVLLAELLERPRVVPVVAVSLLLCTTRPDGLLFVAVFFAVLVVTSRPAALRAVPLVAVGLAGLVAWRWFTFGQLFPHTYYAKSADLSAWAAGWSYWLAFLRSEPGVVLAAVVLAVLGARRRAGPAFAVASLGAWVLYVAKVGGDFMEYRFAFEAIPLLAWGLARGLVELQAPEHRGGVVLATAGCLALGALPSRLDDHFGMASFAFMTELADEGRSIGARLRAVLPADTRLATTLAGTLPYEWGGFVVDEWGLTDPFVGRLPSVPIKTRGHVKFAPLDYLRRRGVHLVIDHPAVCSCARGCEMPWPQVYVRLEGDRCLRTRYLTQTPALTRLFCSDPRFVVREVDCAHQPVPGELQTPLAAAPVAPPGRDAGRARTWNPISAGELLAARRGVALGQSPAAGALPGQQPVRGFATGLINSFHGGDETTGWLTWTPPAGARAVRGRVGGGADCARVYVGVLQAGKVIARACGNNSEQLKPFEFDLPRGAQVVVVDAATSSWGHLLVSDLEVSEDG